MSFAVASQTGLQCRAACRAPASRAPRAGKRFFTGTALVPELRSHGVGTRKVISMSLLDDQIGGAYASALVEVAQEKNSLDEIHADVDALSALFSEDEEVKNFLFNPVVEDEQKREIISKISKEAGLTEHTSNFLNLLIDGGRFSSIEAILEAFEQSYCKVTDTQVAILTSAVKLEQEQQFLIAKKLQELTGSKNIKLKPEIDEDLLGGFVVKYGSTQIDMSLKGQVDAIEAELRGDKGGLA